MPVVHDGGISNPAMDHHTGLLAPNFSETPHQAAAVQMKLQVRLALTQNGPELVEKGLNGVAIGGMVVAAQKGQAGTSRQWGRLLGPFHHPRAGAGGGPAQGFGLNHPPLHLAVAEGEIHGLDRFKLKAFHLFDRLEGAFLLRPLQGFSTGRPELAEVVEIGIAKQHLGLRAELLHQGQRRLGNGVSGDVHRIKLLPSILQEPRQREDKG